MIHVTIRFSRLNDMRDIIAIFKARHISAAEVDDDDMASLNNDDTSDTTDEAMYVHFILIQKYREAKSKQLT
jgi:hypothetical protein